MEENSIYRKNKNPFQAEPAHFLGGLFSKEDIGSYAPSVRGEKGKTALRLRE